MRYWKAENPQVFDAFLDAHPEFSVYMGADVPATRRMSTVSGGTTGTAGTVGGGVSNEKGAEGGEKGAQPEEQSDARRDDDGTSGGPRAATKADTPDLEKVALDTV
jgi:hypothetical protein